MDLATAAGIPETIKLGGKEYSARLLTMRERGVLQRFLMSKHQSPVTHVGNAIDEADAFGKPLSNKAVDHLYARAKVAATTWPPRFGSPAWFDAVDGIEGGWEQVLYEVLSKGDPDFTLEQAEKLAPSVTLDEWSDLIRVAFWGTPPAPKDEGVNGASPTTESPSGTTGTSTSASSTTNTGSTPSGSST